MIRSQLSGRVRPDPDQPCWTGPIPTAAAAAVLYAQGARPASRRGAGETAFMIALGNFASKFFGSANDRKVKSYQSRVDEINALEPEIEELSDDELRARTVAFRAEIAAGETLDDLLVPGLRHRTRGGQALARPAPLRRAADRRHGAARGQYRRDEDRRGQDTRRHAAGLSERAGDKGVHVVTVNDYLAQRDAEWMGQVYRFLGLDRRLHRPRHRRPRAPRAYACDVTYGTNNELGFDYLRDNMKYELEPDGAARSQFRDRRRGRLDPHRRGAYPADHLRPRRGPL